MSANTLERFNFKRKSSSSINNSTDSIMTSTAMDRSIDLATCTPEDLGRWLVRNRFFRRCTKPTGDDDNDEDDTAANDAALSFLQQTIRSLTGDRVGTSAVTPASGIVSCSNSSRTSPASTMSNPPQATAAASSTAAAPSFTTTTAVTTIPADVLGGTLLTADRTTTDGGAAQDASSDEEVSCIAPRGKFKIQWHRDGVVLTDKKDNRIVVPALTTLPGSDGTAARSVVRHVVVFPKPEDCQQAKTKTTKKNAPPSTDLVLVVFDDQVETKNAVTYKGKPVKKQICFQLPTNKPVWKVGTQKAASASDAMDLTEQWIQVLCTSLHLNREKQVARVLRPDGDSQRHSQPRQSQFRSFQESNTSTTTGNMPFITCYKGVQDGALYPMEEGLLFYKPPHFVPRSRMNSIDCSTRGSGGNASRYIDVVVGTRRADHGGGDDDDDDRDGERIEYTNIHKSELSVLNKYIHHTLIPAMQRDVDADDDDDDADNVASAEIGESSSADDNHDEAEAVAVVASGAEGDDGEEEVEGAVAAAVVVDGERDAKEEEAGGGSDVPGSSRATRVSRRKASQEARASIQREYRQTKASRQDDSDEDEDDDDVYDEGHAGHGQGDDSDSSGSEDEDEDHSEEEEHDDDDDESMQDEDDDEDDDDEDEVEGHEAKDTATESEDDSEGSEEKASKRLRRS